MTHPSPPRSSVASRSERTPWRKAAKADGGARIVAALVDGAIATLLGLVPWVGGLLGAGYILLRDGLPLPFMDRRSVGKRLVGIRPVRTDGRAMTPLGSVQRNWTLAPAFLTQFVSGLGTAGLFLFPALAAVGTVLLLLETVRFVNDPDGQRWGDKVARTRVVKTDERASP